MASNDSGVLVPHEDVVGEDEGPSGSRAGPQGPDAAAGEEQTSAPSAFDTDMANIDIIRCASAGSACRLCTGLHRVCAICFSELSTSTTLHACSSCWLLTKSQGQ